MKIAKAFLLAAAAGAMAASVPASAVTFTFGSFSFVGPTKVQYDNATGILSGTNVEINFNYDPNGVLGTPATGFGPQSAMLTFSAHSLTPVTTFAGLGFQDLQLDSFSILRTTPFNGSSNLLSGDSTLGTLSGVLGGSTAGFTSSMGAGATINYNSDFLTFPPPTDADLAWTFTSVTPPLGVSGSNFSSFEASVAGTFGYNSKPSAVVPEPGVVTMLLGAGVGGALFLRRKTSVRA